MRFDAMPDGDFFQYAMKGNADAIEFIRMVHDVSHAWDDMIDRDKPLTPEQINKTFFTALVGIPSNPFFREHNAMLLPVMAASCFNYQIANEFERSSEVERHIIAHSIRYAVADVLLHAAFIVGGHDWITEVGPEIRSRAQRDTLGNYLKEVEAKHAAH